MPSNGSDFSVAKTTAANNLRRRFGTGEILRGKVVELPDGVTAKVLLSQNSYRYVRKPTSVSVAVGDYVSVLNPGGDNAGKLWEILNIIPNPGQSTYGNNLNGVLSLNFLDGQVYLVPGLGIDIEIPDPNTNEIRITNHLSNYPIQTYATYTTYQTYTTSYPAYNTYPTYVSSYPLYATYQVYQTLYATYATYQSYDTNYNYTYQTFNTNYNLFNTYQSFSYDTNYNTYQTTYNTYPLYATYQTYEQTVYDTSQIIYATYQTYQSYLNDYSTYQVYQTYTYPRNSYNTVYGTAYSTVGITIDGGGQVISSGYKGFAFVPKGGEFTRWTILADRPGAIMVELYQGSFTNFPNLTRMVVGGEVPNLTYSSQKQQGTNMTGWDTLIEDESVVGFYTYNIQSVRRIHLTMEFDKDS